MDSTTPGHYPQVLSLSLCFSGNTSGIRWAAVVRRKRRRRVVVVVGVPAVVVVIDS